MQWKQIKTLFILCFLVLNVYLLVALINKQEEANFSVREETDIPLKEQLEAENISIDIDLPDTDLNGSYMALKQETFTDDDLDTLKNQDDQEAAVIDKKLIMSRFEEPVSIPDDADQSDLYEQLQGEVLSSEDYTFGGWNKEMNALLFYQQQNGRSVYYDKNGVLIIYLNDDQDMVFYTQTMLKADEDASYEDQELLEPKKAIQKLLNSNSLENGDNITDFKMNYHPRPETEGVFSPTWTITVNDEDRHYVDAIEDKIYSSDELTFLTGAVTSTIEKIQEQDEDNELQAELSALLKNRLSTIQESE